MTIHAEIEAALVAFAEAKEAAMAGDYRQFVHWNKHAKCGFQMRCHFHTPEELEAGMRENPAVVTMPIEVFRSLIREPLSAEDVGKTAVLFPTDNVWLPFFRFIPYYPG